MWRGAIGATMKRKRWEHREPFSRITQQQGLVVRQVLQEASVGKEDRQGSRSQRGICVCLYQEDGTQAVIQEVLQYNQTFTMDEVKGNAFIIDNFLDKFDAEILEQEMYNWDTFPWYCVPRNVAGMNADVNPVHDVYFKHDFFFNAYGVSSSIDIIKPIIKKLVPLSLVRIRANLNTGTEKPFRFGFHTDFPDVITAIYYVNTNNGMTVFEDGQVVESVKGRLVLFDSNLTHTTQTQTDTSTRMLINFNYIPEAVPAKPGEGHYGR